MEIFDLKQFIKAKWQTLTVFVLVLTTLAFAFSLVQPQKYRSEQRFLVVSRYAEDVDPYAATRSTEYLSNLLSEVMYSQRFMNSVLTSGFAVDQSIFPELPKKRAKAWKKTLGTRVLGDTGIIDVSVYHKGRFTAEQLALAVGQVLRSQHSDYHSRGESVAIQTIDQPITSIRPVQPNILLNTAVGFALGLISGLAFVYLFPKREVDFIGREKHVLNGVREPDWSAPVAEPSIVYENVQPMTVMEGYEASEFKYPGSASPDKTTEIGYQPQPPDNLPIA